MNDHCKCDVCQDWADKKNAEIKRLRNACSGAMVVLESCSVGGVGKDGMTLKEMQECWEAGVTVEDSSEYDLCQHAWHILNYALAGKDGIK